MGVLAEWRFCPRCGAEIALGDGRADCAACGFTTWACSAPTASALVLDGEGRVLLGRRAFEPDRGRWDLLGGFLHEGEHPLDGLRRELAEETGLELEPLDFLGIFMDVYGDGPAAQRTLNMVWTARVAGGEMRPADDVAELRWFDPEELPSDDELAFRCVAQALRAWGELPLTPPPNLGGSP